METKRDRKRKRETGRKDLIVIGRRTEQEEMKVKWDTERQRVKKDGDQRKQGER